MPQLAARLASPPEPGDLVEVRGRRWIVSEIDRSTAPDPGLTAQPPEHLLTLASVEDDGMGEELRVVWEVEPGAQVIPGYGLPEPDGFDDPHRLDAFLLAVRWGAVSSADLHRPAGAARLDHAFHETKQGLRFTVIPDRLLELNHERYAADVAAGLHEPTARKKRTASTGRRPRKAATPAPAQLSFDTDDN